MRLDLVLHCLPARPTCEKACCICHSITSTPDATSFGAKLFAELCIWLVGPEAVSEFSLHWPFSLRSTQKILDLCSADTCPGEVAQFEAKMGIFLSGKTEPPLKGVKITVSVTEEKDNVLLTVETNDKGTYRSCLI